MSFTIKPNPVPSYTEFAKKVLERELSDEDKADLLYLTLTSDFHEAIFGTEDEPHDPEDCEIGSLRDELMMMSEGEAERPLDEVIKEVFAWIEANPGMEE